MGQHCHLAICRWFGWLWQIVSDNKIHSDTDNWGEVPCLGKTSRKSQMIIQRTPIHYRAMDYMKEISSCNYENQLSSFIRLQEEPPIPIDRVSITSQHFWCDRFPADRISSMCPEPLLMEMTINASNSCPAFSVCVQQGCLKPAQITKSLWWSSTLFDEIMVHCQ